MVVTTYAFNTHFTANKSSYVYYFRLIFKSFTQISTPVPKAKGNVGRESSGSSSGMIHPSQENLLTTAFSAFLVDCREGGVLTFLYERIVVSI